MPDLFSLFAGFYWLPLALSIAALVHAYRNGAAVWWYFVIFFFQPLGALIYFAVEVLPGVLNQQSQVSRAHAHRRKPTRGDLNRLRALVDDTPTPRNWAALADALAQHGQAPEAVRIYREECVRGHNANDPELLEGLARAQLAAGDGAGALETLARIPDQGISAEKNERALLKGRALALARRLDEALALLEALAPVYAGQEARLYLADVQARLGQKEAATVTYQHVIKEVRRLKGPWRTRQVPLLRRAQKGLKGLK